jgi:TRAP-type uncharacterized transport system fused permease subunit
MRTGWEAVRFGAVKYILPFFFVYNPALVAQNATLLQILFVFAGAVLGVGLLSYALQGYLIGVGSLANTVSGFIVRGLLVVAGILLAAPELISSVIGLALAAATYAVLLGASSVRKALLTGEERSGLL